MKIIQCNDNASYLAVTDSQYYSSTIIYKPITIDGWFLTAERLLHF